VRRISRRRHDRARLAGGFDHGNQKILDADFQVLLQQHGIAFRYADDRGRRIGRQYLQLRQDGTQIVGTVFAVQQQPVESGLGADLEAVGIAHRGPQADQPPAVGQRTLEGILRQIHAVALVKRSGS